MVCLLLVDNVYNVVLALGAVYCRIVDSYIV